MQDVGDFPCDQTKAELAYWKEQLETATVKHDAGLDLPSRLRKVQRKVEKARQHQEATKARLEEAKLSLENATKELAAAEQKAQEASVEWTRLVNEQADLN